MLKKILTFSFIALFLSNQAFASGSEGLRLAIDEFNYSLTVKWDQKNAQFFKAQEEKLALAISESGLSAEQVLDVVVSDMQDAQLAKEMKRTMSLLKDSDMTEEEAQQFIEEAVVKSQKSGANWHGSSAIPVAMAICAVMVLVGLAILVSTAPNEKK